jgi:hypothetical protein
MKVVEIEQRIFELEEIRIVIRESMSHDFDLGYDYQKKADKSASITEWIATRVRPIVGNREVVVIDGSGAIPHGRTKLSKLRDSYAGD